ncbi:MAG: O-antigen ligase family protein [Bacteroidetes bacterium]|nr:O-antigen ligase family protein [Bacteroidota bacterium]
MFNLYSAPRESAFLNHFMIFLLMGISSIPILIGNPFLIISFFLALVIFFLKGLKIDSFIISYSLAFLGLFFVHIFVYNQFIYSIFIAYFLRIFLAYFIIKIVGKNSDRYIINQIYFFAIISLIITFLFYLFPQLIDFVNSEITPFFDRLTYFHPNRQHFIIYTMELGWKLDIPRNSGPFWEPGGFAIFLFVALFFNIARHKKIVNLKNIIFFLSIITTQSTSAYLALFVFVILFIVIRYKLIYSAVVLPILVIVFFNLYSKLDFMEGKVEKMYSESQIAYKERVNSRIVSGNINFSNFLSSPIFGIGRFFQIEDEENTGNNGTTLLLAEFGIVGFSYYMICMYASYKNYCKALNFNNKYPFVIIISILILGYSQGIFQKPFFIGLSFMYLINFKPHLNFEYKNILNSNSRMRNNILKSKTSLALDAE